ncbi:unnamed protein product [Allacma fusca]|uniref:Uncharacterized protein n=1 Tax=Allacma fusca TaxID=39272 RepID=A0A8J2JKA0_9HEXA|nr:unnamed protein product [Allacma fusca]
MIATVHSRWSGGMASVHSFCSDLLFYQEYLSIKPFHFLPFINAFEDHDNQIILDINAYTSLSYIEALYLSKLTIRAYVVEI